MSYRLSYDSHLKGLNRDTNVNTKLYAMLTIFYKIIRIVRALSLGNSCVQMSVWQHGCDITRILAGRKYESVSRTSVSIKK